MEGEKIEPLCMHTVDSHICIGRRRRCRDIFAFPTRKFPFSNLNYYLRLLASILGPFEEGRGASGRSLLEKRPRCKAPLQKTASRCCRSSPREFPCKIARENSRKNKLNFKGKPWPHRPVNDLLAVEIRGRGNVAGGVGGVKLQKFPAFTLY